MQLRRQSGSSLIEILVTIVVVVLGMLGLAGIHARLQTSELESYQRAQALMLLRDMSSRVSANRTAADAYALGAPANNPLGAGATCNAAPVGTVQRDLAQWCAALQGAAEVTGPTATRVGAMIGGRGCIERPDPSAPEYRITVVWQGLTPLTAPPATLRCGVDLYNATDGGACVNDRCRRYVTTTVRIANLATAVPP